MKNRNELNQKDMEDKCGLDYKMDILNEILLRFKPATFPADYEPTSVEFADMVGETIAVTPSEMAILLAKRGFHVELEGSVFRWQMDYNK